MALLAWFKLDDNLTDSWGDAIMSESSGITNVDAKMNRGKQTHEGGTYLEYFSIPDDDDLNVYTGGDLSMSVFYKHDSSQTDDSGFIFSKPWNGSGQYNYFVRVYGSSMDLQLTLWGSTNAWKNSAINAIPDDTFVRVTLTLNGTTKIGKVYVNETEVISLDFSSITSWTPPAGDLNYNFCLGTYYPYGHTSSSSGRESHMANGVYDDFRIYNHVLSVDEIAALSNGTQITIDGYSYSREMNDSNFDQTALFRLRTADIELGDDSSDTIINRLDNGQDIQIFLDYSLVFRGLVERFDFSEEKIITIDAIDYSFYLAEDFITYSASSKTASQIVTDLINLYGNNLFTQNITATTFVYTSKKWRAYSPLEIIQELALDEGYTFFVDENRIFNFVPQDFKDTGITLVDGDTIFKRKFPFDNTKLKNKIIVVGQGATSTAGIRVVVRDPDSINKYGQRAKRIEDTSITTEDQAIERANSELSKLANPLTIGEILVARNVLLSGGSLIRITVPQKNWTSKQFLIIESEHNLETPITTLSLAEINPYNSDQLGNLLFQQRLTAKNWEDDGTPVSNFERWTEEIEVEMLLYVEKQAPPSRDWNEFEFNSTVNWDTVPSSWTTILNGEVMGITTNGLNRLRDLIAGKAVTAFDATNSNIAIGTGTTAFNIADTTLGTESYRASMDSGFPRDGSVTGENEHQSSWTDSDFSSGTFSEMGLFDNSAGGLLLGRVVPSTTFGKSASENLRVRTVLRLFQ